MKNLTATRKLLCKNVKLMVATEIVLHIVYKLLLMFAC
jgi:hypothetical protein